MVQQPAKYYQKVEALSQQAAPVSLPPAWANLSNPPPLWGPKFLLSTSGSAYWRQTRFELCPHASTFACQSEHFPLPLPAATPLKPNRHRVTLKALLFLFSPPLKKTAPSFSITVRFLKETTLWNHCEPKYILPLVTSRFAAASVSLARKWQSQVRRKESIWIPGRTKLSNKIQIGCSGSRSPASQEFPYIWSW